MSGPAALNPPKDPAAPTAPIVWMAAGCAAAAAIAAATFGATAGRDVALGMAAPLVAVAATWLRVVHVHRRDPAGVTAALLQAFLVKLVFFGAYVVAVWLLVRPGRVAFIASFTGSFLTLYLAEAVLMQRLFRGEPRT
jgi:hypothetical protein